MKTALGLSTIALLCSGLSFAQVDQTEATVEYIDEITAPEEFEIDPGNWILEKSETWSVDGSDAGSSADFKAKIHKLSLAGPDETALVLSCQIILEEGVEKSQLNAAFDLEKSVDKARRRMNLRHITGKLQVGEKAKSERWIWNPDTMRVVPHNREVPRRLFNAGVRGDNVRLKVLGKWQIEMQLPEMNDQFKAFAKACPALQPKKK
ncbi:MAG: hypothetical protein P8H62_06205 [Henriciella sp.]|jgi:hypothetical protein|nr:hypothetical protein [Henriciella sp.]